MARPIYQIAGEIVEDMKREYLEANQNFITGKTKSKPKHWTEKYCYFVEGNLKSMQSINTINDNYICESGSMVVAYALGNLTTWKGEKAKAIKAELNAMLKGK